MIFHIITRNLLFKFYIYFGNFIIFVCYNPFLAIIIITTVSGEFLEPFRLRHMAPS